MELTRRLIIAGGAAALLAPRVSPEASALAQGGQGRSTVPRRRLARALDLNIGDVPFSPNDPEALWQEAGPATLRIFLRKQGWAVIWYVQDQSPVDGQPFDVVVIERQRWTDLANERPAVSYVVSVAGLSTTIRGHGDFQRWVLATRNFPTSDRLLDDWQARGLMLPWGIGPRLRAPGQWGWMPPVPAYSPLDPGGITVGMATTGLRDEIGPIINRQARYVMERSGEMRAVTLKYGLSAGSIPWHVRAADGLPLLLDRPGTPLKLQQYYQNYPEEQTISVSPGMAHEWSIDNAHRPCPAFLPALLSGLHPFFLEEQVFSACAALNSVQPETRGPQGKWVDEGQARDWAWSMRDMLLAYALLQAMPGADWLPAAARFEAILLANLDRALSHMARPGPGQIGMFWASTLTDGAPNPTFWAAQQSGQRQGVYSGGLPNYIAYILDWGRRLHGDPRWLDLQILFAQRFQARCVLALGPYAFQNLPVRIEGRWVQSWQEVARVCNVTPAMAGQRWATFQMPVDDRSIYPYGTEFPAMVYNGLKLAQATGRAGNEVDRAIALLEANMGRMGEESWPAFAMRHDR
jgi:hypothetical protein